jgi:hypothetical protein
MSRDSNRASAPKCAAFVDRLRAVFPDAKALFVEEGTVKLGEPDEGPFAACNVVDYAEADNDPR